MAAFKILFTVILSLATSSAAPKLDGPTVIETPMECKDQEYCSIKPKGYDELEDTINSLLPDVIVKDYTDRFGDENRFQPPQLSPEEDWHNCPYEMKTEQIYIFNYGENNNETAIVVQTKLFKQFVETVTCAVEHIDIGSEEQCFNDFSLSAFDMMSSCQTITAKRTLYVYDDFRKQVVQKPFELPVCCTCIVSYK